MYFNKTYLYIYTDIFIFIHIYMAYIPTNSLKEFEIIVSIIHQIQTIIC